MSLWNWLFGRAPHALNEDVHSTTASTVNPATGLPMVNGDSTGIDVGGSPYGFDAHDHSPTSAGCDSFGSGDHWST